MSFIHEVLEQAQRLKDFCENDHVLDGLAGLNPAAFQTVIFTGMGSSYAASYLGAMLATEKGVHALFMEPDTLQFSFPQLIKEDTLVVAVSQSGNSPETVKLAASVPAEQLLAIVNCADSPLGRMAKYRVLLHAGHEQHTASKTYTNSIAAAYRVAEWLAGCKESVLDEAPSLCDAMQHILDNQEAIGEKISVFFEDAKEIVTIGSGVCYATAFQADYVLAEMDQVFTKAITAAQFFHGMIESANENYRVILSCGDPRYADRIEQVLAVLKERKSKCALLVPALPQGMEADENLLILPVGTNQPYLFPMADILFIEILGYALGLRRGLHPGDLTYVHK